MGEEYPDRDVVVERGEEALELGFVSALLVGREVLVLVLVPVSVRLQSLVQVPVPA